MIPRFFIELIPSEAGQIALSVTESRHALSVLRLAVGEAVEIFDAKGNGQRGFIASKNHGIVTVQLEHVLIDSRRYPFRIDLAFAVIKAEPAELLIQKACELGAGGLFPLITQRSVIKIDAERWRSKEERWRKIAIASCKQCGRSQMPAIAPVAPFKEFVTRFKDYDKVFIPTLAVKGQSFYQAAFQGEPKKILVLIGPEGDFTKQEVDDAVGAGASAVSLGPLVMRAETAALYALSALHFYYGGKTLE